MEVKSFREYEGRKTIYGVTGTTRPSDAIKAVMKKKKENTNRFIEYETRAGVIAPFGDDQIGLYKKGDASGENCIMVWR